MKISPLAIALALTVCCTPALAREGHEAGPGQEMHCQMDMSGMSAMSGMSPADRQKKMDEMFASMDANKNGSISKAEFTSHHEAMMKKHHEGMGKSDHGCKMDDDKMKMDHDKMKMDHEKMEMEEKKASGK